MWTLEGLGVGRRGAGPRADEGRRSADPHPGDPRQRDALQGRRPIASPPTTRRWRRTPTSTSSIQAVMTLNTLKVADASATIKAALEGKQSKGVAARRQHDPQSRRSAPGAAASTPSAPRPSRPRNRPTLDKGKEIYTAALLRLPWRRRARRAAARGAPGTTLAPPLASSPRVLGHPDYVIKALLHGLTGPLNGATYPEVMVPMGQNTDDWIAVDRLLRAQRVRQPRLDHLRRRRGARARRDASATRRAPGRSPSSKRRCRAAGRDPGWKLTASHNAATAPNALSIQPWTSGDAQKPGHVVPDRAAAAGRS